MNTKNVGIKKAIIINMFAKYSTVFIQLIINAILSRLLIPSEFGVVAIITVFINFFNILADLGMGSAIIQNKRLTNEDNENIFSFTIYLGIILGIIFVIFSFPISWIYKNSVYVPIGLLMFFSIFFNTINMVPNALLLKEKKFLDIGIRTISVTLLSGIITIILAFLNFSYYALVINSILSSILIFVWNYSKIDIKLKFKFSKDSINKIRSFSFFQFAFSLVNYFSRNTDNLLIGSFMGTKTLAFYDKSYKLMLYPINMLSNVVTPVLHPILSEYQDNKKLIYKNYIKIVKLLSLLACFISVFCFWGAKEIVLIMFGDNWIGAVSCFRILSFSIFAQMVCVTTGSIYQSLGRTKELFKVGVVNTFITVILIIIGLILNNLEIISFFVSIAYNIHFLITYYVLIVKIFNYKFSKFINEIKNEIFIFIILLICTFFIDLSKNGIIISIVIKFLYLFIAYLLLLLLTKEYKSFINFIKKDRGAK